MKKNPALRANRLQTLKRALGLIGLAYVLVGAALGLVRRVTWPAWLKVRFEKRAASRPATAPATVAATESQEGLDAMREPVGERLNV